MAKTAFWQWSGTAASNTDVGGFNISGNGSPSNLDDGLREVMAQLKTQGSVSTSAKSADYTVVTPDDYGAIISMSASGAARTVTLPAAADAGSGFNISVMKSDSSSNTVTIDGNGSETINGATTLVLYTQYSIATLVCDGSNWVVSESRGASAWEHIRTVVASSNSSLDFTGLGAFRRLRISGFLIPATDGDSLLLRTDANNGASWDSGASDYSYHWLRGVSDAAAAGGSVANGSLVLSTASGVGNDTGEGIQIDITVDQFNQTNRMYVTGTVTMYSSTGIAIVATIGGRRLSNLARDAIQLFFSSGNISSGMVTLEGVRSA